MTYHQNRLKCASAVIGLMFVTTGCEELMERYDDLAALFPSDLAIASPLSYVDADRPGALSSGTTPSYTFATEELEAALTGAELSPEITPDNFISSGHNADCYGPNLMWENHPDDSGTASGSLPGGDLGLWSRLDAEGNACAAAQLNAQMHGMEGVFGTALLMAAVMAHEANEASKIPAAGDTSDVLTEMTAIAPDIDRDGTADITFSAANLTQNSDGTWEYDLQFEYTQPSTAKTFPTVILLSHAPGASETEFTGTLWFRVTGESTDFPGGNCPSTSDRTRNGSIAYERTSETSMKVQSRMGIFCGADVDGRNSDGVVDATMSYDASSEPNGWSENFSIMTGEFDPTTTGGSYSYAWQAGAQDHHSRVFNVGVNHNTSGTAATITGEAWFGFGTMLQEDDDGSVPIDGFICNWAGPGANHTLHEYAQRQFISLDDSTGLFEASESASNIRYAPTNSCTYDGSGTFAYDRDLDDDLSDEDATTVNVETVELYQASDMAGCTETTIWGVMTECRGYDLPTPP